MTKMKKLNQIIIQKGLFASIKENLCLTRGHLDNSEGQVEIESPNCKLFLISLIHIKKKIFFSKSTLLMKQLIFGCFLFLKSTLYIVLLLSYHKFRKNAGGLFCKYIHTKCQHLSRQRCNCGLCQYLVCFSYVHLYSIIQTICLFLET